jgi:hypothetical protein
MTLQCADCAHESYKVIDINGRSILSGFVTGSKTTIATDQLSTGIYQLILFKPEKNIILRFVKSSN